VSILIAGNYCHDTLLGNSGEQRTLGGSAAYAAAILDALGEPYEVVAKVGPDFLYADRVLKRAEIVPGARTTAFVDDYRPEARRGRVEALCEPIRPEDLRGSHQIGIACGIAGEVLPETLRRMRAICDLVIADAQALLRHVSADGEVLLRPPHPDAVAQLDFLKASRSEAAWLDVPTLRRRLTLLITDGSRGSTLLAADREIHVEAFPATQIDPTGAGDCFLAGFAVGLARGLGPERAARIGAYCGARAVEQVGVPRLTPQQAADAIRSAR